MISSETKIQVRYDEVDKMGYVYHGNYARYFHVSRTELLRKVGICDRELESQNIILPVIEMNVKYLKPVYYDEIITIRTTLDSIPVSRMEFKHTVFNPQNEIINIASSTVVFVESQSRKPKRVSEETISKIEQYIKSLI